MPLGPEDAGRSAFSWALWKRLDRLTARVLAPGTGAGGLAPASEVDPAALQAAVAEMADNGSPVVGALAQLLGRDYASEQERSLALDRAMAGLSREQGLVVAAVVLYAIQSARHIDG
jgi:hypothetical protein